MTARHRGQARLPGASDRAYASMQPAWKTCRQSRETQAELPVAAGSKTSKQMGHAASSAFVPAALPEKGSGGEGDTGALAARQALSSRGLQRCRHAAVGQLRAQLLLVVIRPVPGFRVRVGV